MPPTMIQASTSPNCFASASTSGRARSQNWALNMANGESPLTYSIFTS